MADKEVKCCKECGSLSVIESAYSKMTERQKVELAAQEKAIDFLKNLQEGYNQDSTSFGMVNEKLKFLDTPEKIPIVSDVFITQLQKLLVNFYFRDVKLELQSK